ncbi:6-aminohexanoate-dimer hydrolase [compost metagenome]
MSTGHSQDTTFTMVQSKSDWAKAFLEIPIEHEPGTYFLYNTGATYMLSAILEKATGQKLLDYLRPKLFEPLGISGVTTISCPQGIHVGGFGMSMTTEDIAKFGQLYLQKGVWQGQRILSEEWVLAATSEQVSNAHSGQGDWSQGYGFQFWRCQHNSYRGDGAFGQFCVVMPEQDAVIAMTAGYMEMQAMLELVWQHLLPGMTDSAQGAGPAIHQALLQRLNDVSYLRETGDYGSPSEWKDAAVSYRVSPNTAQILEVSFSGDDQEVCITLVDANGTSELRAGFGSFSEGEAELDGFRFRYAACGVWRKRNVLEIALYMTELALSDVITCHFVNDSVQISASRNVWVSPILSDMGLLPTIIGSRFEDRDTWIGNTKQ